MDACCQEVADDLEKYGRWMGGSHYHCGRCDAVSSMYGHARSIHWKPGGKDERVPFHFCCPNDCELENVDEIQAEYDMWLALQITNNRTYPGVLEDIKRKLDFALKLAERS